jgi:hypothetical protein
LLACLLTAVATLSRSAAPALATAAGAAERLSAATAPVTISGRLLADGKPVGGVTVYAMCLPSCTATKTLTKSGRTLADGTFTLSGIPAVYDIYLPITPKLNTATTTLVDARAGGDFAGRDLLAGSRDATLSGTVTDWAGTPLASADVSIEIPLQGQPGQSVPMASVTTDAQGRYTVRVAAGSYVVTVSKSGLVTQTVTNVSIPSAGATRSYTLVPQGGSTPTPTPITTIAPTPATTMTPTQTPASSPTPSTAQSPTPMPTSTPPTTVNTTSHAMAAGAVRLTTTFNSIGIELPITGDANANAEAALEIKSTTDSSWRSGLPLWRTDDGSQRTFFGSAMLLEPGTGYDVRVKLSDSDGVVGSTVVTGSITTRADNIPARESLTPTHFVRTDGNDANSGTSRVAAWRTIEKAILKAPSSAVVEVGPGYYSRPAPGRSLPLTLLAQYPAVDDARDPIHAGQRSVIESGPVTSPAGSDGPNAGAWQHVTLAGPGQGGAPAGASYTVWKWVSPGLKNVRNIAYASTREAMPERIALWMSDSADLSTPAGWAEKLFTNQSYNYGAFQHGDELYLRLPPNAPANNPNSLYISIGNGPGLTLNGSNSRASGFEIRMANTGIQIGTGTHSVVDHNLLVGIGTGIGFRGGAEGPPSVYGSDHVVEHNRIVDKNLWTADHAGQPAIPWRFIKGAIVNADGTTYRTGGIGAFNSSNGISGSGTAQRVVIRRNTIEGTFNGVGDGSNDDYDRYAAQDMDVHDNLIRRVSDDAIEPEGIVINFRAWNNRIEHTSTVLSTGPVNIGPIYLFRNEAWRTGNAGAGPYNDGSRGVGGRLFKFSGDSSPTARIFVLHNTFWTDQTDPQAIDGGSQSASSGSNTEGFYLRNNILRVSKDVFEAPTAPGRWNEDYNHFSTSDPARGLEFGVRFRTDVGAYRAASGQGAHTNVSSDFITPPDLVNPTAGDLRLPSGSPLIDAGTQVPNISDRPGVNYKGSAPDLGAREH